jgi:Zn-finger nucleic acid-binding protein
MTKYCPRTGVPLREFTFDGVTLDFSDGCGGVFFDRFEIAPFEGSTSSGGTLAEMMASHHDLSLDYRKRITCPNDPDVVMQRRFYSPKRGVQLDECPKCGGLWLDGDELESMRYEVPDEATRKKLDQEFIEEVMRSRHVVNSDLAHVASIQQQKNFRIILEWVTTMIRLPF